MDSLVVRTGPRFQTREALFRQMLDALPAAAYTCDATGLITSFNAHAVALWGRTPKLNDPEDRYCGSFESFSAAGIPIPRDACWMALALRHDQEYNDCEIGIGRPDGTRITALAHVSPLHDENGVLIGAVNVLSDITDRNREQEALRHREQELADFFDNSVVALHWVGADGTILRANQAELDLLGYPREEYVGRNIREFYVDPEAISDILARLGCGEELHSYEARLRCKDGSMRYVLISSNVLWDNGRFVHTRCFTRDITERKRAEQRLAFLVEASELLSASLDYERTLGSLTELVVPTIADWCAVYLLQEDGSAQEVALKHQDPEHLELLRTLFAEYPHAPDALAVFSRAIRTGEPQLLEEIPKSLYRAIAGDARQLELLDALGMRSELCVPLAVRGEIMGAMVLATGQSGRRLGQADLRLAEDVARRASTAIDNARLYQKTHEALTQRDRFLSVAAHELKTPLTGLRLSTQLLQRLLGTESWEPAHVATILDRLDNQTGKLAHLVEQLLNISRMQPEHFALDLAATDVRSLLDTVVDTIRAIAPQYEIRVSAPDSLMVDADAMRLEQMMTNLLDNAVKYSPGGGAIDIRLSQKDADTIELAVRDHGVGIPPESRDRVFEPFYRVPGHDRPEGMGLGLDITRQIVELHGGEVRAEFPADGGTRFVVTLPSDLQRSGSYEAGRHDAR